MKLSEIKNIHIVEDDQSAVRQEVIDDIKSELDVSEGQAKEILAWLLGGQFTDGLDTFLAHKFDSEIPHDQKDDASPEEWLYDHITGMLDTKKLNQIKGT